MQTFLPYADFEKTASILDYRRLGKQRVETLQILNVLTGRTTSWANHPAVKMWRGYEGALCHYGLVICDAWIKRGYQDTCKAKIQQIAVSIVGGLMPSWMGNESFHLSHRSNLTRKDPEYYGKFWTVDSNLPYVWPV